MIRSAPSPAIGSSTRRYGACVTARRRAASGVELTGNLVVAVKLDVGVVDAAHVDAVAGHRRLPAGVVQALPAEVEQLGLEIVGGKARSRHLGDAALDEVLERVDRLRCPVVVRPEDEDPGHCAQWLEALGQIRDGVDMAEEVACEDHKIGLLIGQRAHPVHPVLLSRCEVQVSQL